MNNYFEKPLYKQLENIITNKIAKKEYLPGQRLPGTRQIAKKYAVNRLTVNKAIDELVNDGILIKKPSSGTFVRKESENNQLSFSLDFANNGISSILRERGISVENKVFGQKILNSNRYLDTKLELDESELIFGLYRLRSIRTVPFALEYNYLPLKLFPDIQLNDFRYVGLYDYINSRGIKIHNTYKRVQLIKAPANQAKLLKIKKGTLIYMIQYSSIDESDNLVEYTESYLRPDEIHLQFEVNFE